MIMPPEFEQHAKDLYDNGDPDAALALMRIEWDRATLNTFSYRVDVLSRAIHTMLTTFVNQFGEAVQKAETALNDMMAQL